jgi:hypothetical protein
VWAAQLRIVSDPEKLGNEANQDSAEGNATQEREGYWVRIGEQEGPAGA